MTMLEHYRTMYEYEKDCNDKMLTMLESVSEESRFDKRFQRAVTLADHLARGREKWLDFMTGKSESERAWWDDNCELVGLRPRFAALETLWTDYLARLDEDQLPLDFEFTELNGSTWRIPIEVQICQLIGHAAYHRGQIALLVEQLGGETVDTDYADWRWSLAQSGT